MDNTKIVMMQKFPDPMPVVGLEIWLSDNLGKITMSTFLNSKPVNRHLCYLLITLVRRALHNARQFKTPKGVADWEQRIRAQVHDIPQEFCFHTDALRQYHPVHLGEMCRILILHLEKQWHDFSRSGTHAKPYGRIEIANS